MLAKRFMYVCAGLLCAVVYPFGALTEAQAGGCFWPAPYPRCSSWFITEAGLYTRLANQQSASSQGFFGLLSDERLVLATTVGWMRNVGPRTAWGGELFLSADELRGGVAVRMRRWLSPRAAVDAAAGLHLFGYARSQEVKGSPMLSARITYKDQIAAVARLDILSPDPRVSDRCRS